MSGRAAAHGVGLYFIDIFACMLFCLTLALVGARFSRETLLPVDLPRAESRGSAVGELTAPVISLRSGPDGTQLYWEQEPLSAEQLDERLRREPPEALVVRMEASEFTALLASAHAAGVHDIQIAYEAASGFGTPGEGGK